VRLCFIYPYFLYVMIVLIDLYNSIRCIPCVSQINYFSSYFLKNNNNLQLQTKINLCFYRSTIKFSNNTIYNYFYKNKASNPPCLVEFFRIKALFEILFGFYTKISLIAFSILTSGLSIFFGINYIYLKSSSIL
jgi:hypothetical protein